MGIVNVLDGAARIMLILEAKAKLTKVSIFFSDLMVQADPEMSKKFFKECIEFLELKDYIKVMDDGSPKKLSEVERAAHIIVLKHFKQLKNTPPYVAPIKEEKKEEIKEEIKKKIKIDSRTLHLKDKIMETMIDLKNKDDIVEATKKDIAMYVGYTSTTAAFLTALVELQENKLIQCIQLNTKGPSIWKVFEDRMKKEKEEIRPIKSNSHEKLLAKLFDTFKNLADKDNRVMASAKVLATGYGYTSSPGTIFYAMIDELKASGHILDNGKIGVKTSYLILKNTYDEVNELEEDTTDNIDEEKMKESILKRIEEEEFKESQDESINEEVAATSENDLPIETNEIVTDIKDEAIEQVKNEVIEQVKNEVSEQVIIETTHIDIKEKIDKIEIMTVEDLKDDEYTFNIKPKDISIIFDEMMEKFTSMMDTVREIIVELEEDKKELQNENTLLKANADMWMNKSLQMRQKLWENSVIARGRA